VIETHVSPLTCISFPPCFHLDFLNLVLRFNFKHEETQIPTVSVYSSWGVFTLAFCLDQKRFFSVSFRIVSPCFGCHSWTVSGNTN